MADHPRTTIREKVASLLSGQTAAGDRVYPQRVLPVRPKDLPAILVYTWEEDVDQDSRQTAPRELTRDVNVVIDGQVELSAETDKALDALALEIETVMHADPTLGGTASDSLLAGTELGLLRDGDHLYGSVALTYAVTYYGLAVEARDDLDDFLTAATTTNLGGTTHEDDQAHDIVTVQEPPP